MNLCLSLKSLLYQFLECLLLLLCFGIRITSCPFPEYETVPKGKDLDTIFSFIEKYQHVEGAMVECLEYLTEITRDEKVKFTELIGSDDRKYTRK